MQIITQSRTGTGKSTSWKKTLEKDGLTLIDWFDSNQMQANPDRFQAVAVGVKSFEHVKHFTLACVDIPCQENVKLLGVELGFMLNFDKQIKNMGMKAARQLNVLQRLSKFLSVETRLLIFKSFIQSNFNYCPLVWHFCSKANTEKLASYLSNRKTPIQSSQNCF